MKQSKSIKLIIMVSLVLLLLTGCSKKESITTEQFKSKMEENNFKIHDVTDQFSGTHVTEATVAMKEEFQIEFYLLNSSEEASNMFESNKERFKQNKGNSSTESSLSGKESGSYTLNTNDRYQYVCFVDNTVLYLNVTDTYKDEIKTIVKNLGY